MWEDYSLGLTYYVSISFRKERAVNTLVTDPSFSIESVEFLLNMHGDDKPGTSLVRGPTLPYTRSKDKKFVSLEDCELHLSKM